MMWMLSTLLVGAGIALCAYGVGLYRNSRNAALTELLELQIEEPDKSPQELSALMERAGAFTEKALDRTPIAEKFRKILVQVGSPLTAGEFGGMLMFGTLLSAILLLILTESFVAPALVLVGIPMFTMARLKRKVRKRVLKLEAQLPEVLQLVAGSLDSGTSLLTAFELAAEEGDEPLASELGRVVGESAVGRPLIDALEAMANRVGSNDFAWTAKAIRIQNQTGGRLADTLKILAEFMQARVEVRGEIRALSAEARFSGLVLTAMPIVIGGLLFTIRREYVEPLLTKPAGNIMLGAAALGIFLGHVWMKKMGQVEV